jgi:GNAT superfamily N-acetyltransferase
MGFEFGRATTAAEVEAVQRLRYAVYVEELGRYQDVADCASGTFAEPEDDQSWIFYARDGDKVVAATRMTWGGDGFSERQIDRYQLRPFFEEIPAEMMAIGERNSVLPAYRGSGVLDEMLQHSQQFIDAYGIRRWNWGRDGRGRTRPRVGG